MSTAVQMRFETQVQAEKVFPRKLRCAWTKGLRGTHYFISHGHNDIFCSKLCQKRDEQDRPGQ